MKATPGHVGAGQRRAGEQFCPGILHAVPAKDGMLIRIRIPGGFIEARQLSAVAALSSAYADGQIEITSRANLQLRAIKERDLSEIADALTSAKLLPSRRHDRVRNIATSPFAAIGADELIDTRPLVRELDRRLIADHAFASLHPKFSFGIHGGGNAYSHEQDDLALHAFSSSGPFALYLGGTDTGCAVSLDDALDCLLDAARLCMYLANENSLPARGKKLAAAPGLMGKIVEGLSPFLTPSSSLGGVSTVAPAPIGMQQAAHRLQTNIIPSIPLGRLTSGQAQRLAESATEFEAELRLAPWRGVVLGAVPLSHAAGVAAHLESIGLSLDGRDGFQGIAACAGAAGCDASLADVRADATQLARKLAGQRLLPGWTANFSGCEKQCAMRHGAAAELIATSSGYLLRINGQPAPGPCSPESAIGLIRDAHAAHISADARP